MVDTRACPRGLTLREQLAWAVPLQHPAEMWQWPVSEQMRSAVQFEVDKSPEEIDLLRKQLVEKWIRIASELQVERIEVLQKHGSTKCKLRQRLHIPFMQYLVAEMSHEDVGLPMACLDGFPVVGQLPPCKVEASPVQPNGKWTTVETFLENRVAKNAGICQSFKQQEFADDLMSICEKDQELGALGEYQKVTPQLLQTVHVARRIGVRELRSSGWRTRAVDDMRETGMNEATVQADKMINGTIIQLVWFLLMFQSSKMSMAMWKRDIQNAFRRLPVLTAHTALVWIVWMWQSQMLAAPHMGMPFGATASVCAWHRVGAFLAAAVSKLARAPIARYVDDFFGASKEGVYWSGGRILSVLCSLTGFHTDPAKDEDGALEIVVLGMLVTYSWNLQLVTVRLEAEKAARWRQSLAEACGAGILIAQDPAKMAGRLQWALCAGPAKAGRAYLKALFAQANHPFPGGTMSLRLQQAAQWFVKFLDERPETMWSTVSEQRSHVRTWSDASGVDRAVAAVILFENRYFYTVDWISESFITTIKASCIQ